MCHHTTYSHPGKKSHLKVYTKWDPIPATVEKLSTDRFSATTSNTQIETDTEENVRKPSLFSQSIANQDNVAMNYGKFQERFILWIL